MVCIRSQVRLSALLQFLISAAAGMALATGTHTRKGQLKTDDRTAERGEISEPAAPQVSTLPYLDPTLPAMKRAQDLVARLSLEQQVELLLATNQRTGGVNTNDVHIRPYNWWTECNSGIEIEYPQNINIGATFNRTVAFLAGRGTGIGLRKRADAEVQDLSCWSPMTNLMRHPLWGRAHEGYGEDPYLAGEMVFQNVLGIQGFGLEGYPRHSLANTGCKHFSAFDGPMNWGTAVLSDTDWFLNYLPAFERCLDAGSYSVMCSYSSLNGVAGCADARAMQTVLRDTWKLRGFVVSDCGAVQGSPAGAIESIKAGCDLECNPWGQGVYPSLVNSTYAGNISADVIATAAERLLYVRFRLGEWDPKGSVPFADKTKYGKDADMSLYEQVSLEAAQMSLVLLKNDGLLPLNTSGPTPFKTIAAVGIMNCMSAGYDTAVGNKTLTDAALRKAFPDAVVTSGPGCRCPLGTGTNNAGCETCPGCLWAPTSGLALCSNYNASNVTASIVGADLTVLHIGFGGRPGEQTDLTCDRNPTCNLSMYHNQSLMLETVLAHIDSTPGSKLVVVLYTTLPMNITGLVADTRVSAIVQAYYPQHWGGQAVVDVLTGKINPAGRLVNTWPKAYDESLHGEIGNYSMVGTKKTYRYEFPDALFPFGYGLSYTSWAYSEMKVSPSRVQPCDNVTVTVALRNTGDRAGSEVVQLYASFADAHPTSTATGSSRESRMGRNMSLVERTAKITLVNFERVFVEAGHSVQLKLTVTPRHYAVVQEQPRRPSTAAEPNGSWVAPVWEMQAVAVNLHVGGQQPTATPRLPSNVLQAGFVVEGDNSPVSRCPKYVPHDGL